MLPHVTLRCPICGCWQAPCHGHRTVQSGACPESSAGEFYCCPALDPGWRRSARSHLREGARVPTRRTDRDGGDATSSREPGDHANEIVRLTVVESSAPLSAGR